MIILHLIMALILWLLGLILFLLGSTYLHELAHYVAAKAVGFQIAGYRFLTIPFIRHGYVDVRIRGRFTRLPLRKALIHGSGLCVHLFLIGIAIWLILLSGSILWKGFWVIGLLVNFYLFLVNCFPEESDGQKLAALLKNGR